MLSKLHISNYAIIDELDMEFGETLNIITGETGAGKSILTGALSLIQGARADSKVLYDEAKKCIVEATFTSQDVKIDQFLLKNDIDKSDELIISRMINPAGKSRAFVNDTPIKLSALKELSAMLVDLHRQFDTLGINNEHTQISMLDALAEQIDAVNIFGQKYTEYKKNKNKLKKLEAEEQSIQNEIEFLRFQVTELDELGFEKGEQVQLEEEVSMFQNAEQILFNLNQINDSISDREANIHDEILGFVHAIEKIPGPNKALSDLLGRLSEIKEELKDIAYTAQQMTGDFVVDNRLLEQKEERINQLYRLLRKHNKETADDLVDFQLEMHDKISELANFVQDKSTIEKLIIVQEKELSLEATKITNNRLKTAKLFATRLKSILAMVGMEHAQFEIQLNPADTFNQYGKDQIEYMFSANPGKSMSKIKEVASGGELSRLALGLKSIVAGNLEMPTLIFDEIDSGVSGDVAGKMGDLMKNLSKNHQVISITHNAQIAAKADTHFFVYKEVKNKRTYTKVKALSLTDRITEIATMLSGDPPPKTALENAKVLMQ